MNQNEIRSQVIATLLQAGGPLTLPELMVQCGIAKKEILSALRKLVKDNLVIEGQLLADKPGPQYCWWACWAREAERRTVSSKERLREIVDATRTGSEQKLDIDDGPVLAFCNYVINEYQPPRDKRILVILQCSVRRPFSTSPSHAPMRRAISVATGCDPVQDFDRCPVHVVVLASKIGPAPYEFQDIYPANVRGAGVKHFDRTYYARVKPILAERMAHYVTAHGDSYDHIATFTEGRYGEVMAAAKEIVGLDFPVLPVSEGPRIVRVGQSRPRPYWEKYWIQLYLEILRRLDPTQQAQAQALLREMDVEYDNGNV